MDGSGAKDRKYVCGRTHYLAMSASSPTDSPRSGVDIVSARARILDGRDMVKPHRCPSRGIR